MAEGTRKRRERRMIKVALFGLLAAVLALVIGAPQLMSRDALSAPVLAKALTADGGLVGLSAPGWLEPQWSETPGGLGSAVSAGDLKFRIGVLSLDLEVALREQQVGSAVVLSRRLARALSTLESSRHDLSGPAAGYLELAAQLEALEEHDSLSAATKASRRLAETTALDPGLDALSLTFGRWCEAGRLAGLSGNTDLLASEAFRQYVQRLAEREDWPPKVAAEIVRLRDLLQPELNDLQVAAIAVSFEAIVARG